MKKPAPKPTAKKPKTPKKPKHNLGNFKVIPDRLRLEGWPHIYLDPDLQ